MTSNANFDEVNEWLMNPANWVDGAIQSLLRFKTLTANAAVKPNLEAAVERYREQLARGIPDEYLDVDSLLEAHEYGRWVEISFFLGIFAYWESQVVSLSESIEPLSESEERLGRRTGQAIRLLTEQFGLPEDLSPTLDAIKRTRDRVAHDGGSLTTRGREELQELIDQGHVFEFNIDDMGLSETFVADAATSLMRVFRAWSMGIRRGDARPRQ